VSSLWTPEGEHRVGRETAPAPSGGGPPGGRGGGDFDPDEPDGGVYDPDAMTPEEREALAARLDELRSQLVSTPAEVVVANHAYGLFELAAIHLSQQPPNLDQARLAVDALGAIIGGLTGRLGEAEPSLLDALAQIRLTFVQISEMVNAPPGASEGPSPAS
jgi:hypothetical protein